MDGSRISRAGAGLALAAAVLGAAALPARADWLVLLDGSRMETKGPWKEKGKLVVFNKKDGALGSLRLSEVDLEASRKATAEALLPKTGPKGEEAAGEPKKKRMAITDASLPRRAQPPPVAPAANATPATASPVTVGNWRKQVLGEGEGLMIVGTLQNVSGGTASNLSLQISLSDAKGSLLATAPGVFPTRTLPPQGSVEFRATFPGVEDFAGINFDANGWVPPPPPKPEGGEAAAAAAGQAVPPPAEAPAPPPESSDAPPPPPPPVHR